MRNRILSVFVLRSSASRRFLTDSATQLDAELAKHNRINVGVGDRRAGHQARLGSHQHRTAAGRR